MSNYIALIPAAGFGSRMGNEVPKQYLSLLGKPMIYYAIKRLCSAHVIKQVYVVLSPEDTMWNEYDWSAFKSKLNPLFCGGDTRAESVLNGLQKIQETVQADDWVLVHDAARPCLTNEHLANLIRVIGEDETGGLLAVPVADTLKRADAQGRVKQTEPREGLWQAQTPQMFRYGLLVKALQALGTDTPTDEARAVEHLGFHPKLVACDSRNLKVTYPQDLQLAALILENLVD
ncbi:2-C-methyl-D-erythritol 4-phosphate cytidylyltransferase [Sulfurirhabdus autotrophica]|uniref:2-C-methyl-D-erythritol 4-phosphate cytidylyltransferase n=1 Tax=Sulfurirhabdus autotrophica TaxID=1706046 RepID=A0A4V2W361_9PROT|nr:2-C-methyl-D-erythritol 4-phosphate cytidylyltransferase [Sulfurirhabdus autotrophica]TCV90709.1 2-C-methyl-D-erythritol 4-phosphate cytidylyltransferase [Sulfurirhabdus autotrophica]